MEGQENEERTQQEQLQEALEAAEGPQPTPEEDLEEDQVTGEEAKDVATTPEEDVEETEEVTELQRIREELEETRNELRDLRNSEKSEETEDVEDQIESPEPVDFISQDQAEAILDNPEEFASTFNDLLNKVYNMGREFSLREVPDVVTNRVTKANNLNQKAQEFYQQHPQLAKHREYVGYLASKLSSDYNDIDKLFEATAKRAYEELGVQKKATEKEKDRRKSPAFPRKGNFRSRSEGPEEDLNEQQKQINKMIEELK